MSLIKLSNFSREPEHMPTNTAMLTVDSMFLCEPCFIKTFSHIEIPVRILPNRSAEVVNKTWTTNELRRRMSL